MRNNPSGTFCNTPLDDGSICGVVSHDRAHCFKPSDGMTGQQPAHRGTGKQGRDSTASASATTTSPSVLTSVTASAPSSQPVVVAAVTVGP